MINVIKWLSVEWNPSFQIGFLNSAVSYISVDTRDVNTEQTLN